MRVRVMVPVALALALALAYGKGPNRASSDLPLRQVTAPPPGYTGGFGEPTCVHCHTGGEINSAGGTLEVEGLPEAYETGAAYLLAVVLRAEETAAAGFQMTVRYSQGERSGEPAGELRALDGRVSVTLGETGQPYIHHTRIGTTVVNDAGSSWTMEWVAPEGGGPVMVHATANSGNGDESPLGDLIFDFAATVSTARADRP